MAIQRLAIALAIGPLLGAGHAHAQVFEDVTDTALPRLVERTMDAAVADIDGDGDLDLYLASRYRRDRLLLRTGSPGCADPPCSDLAVRRPAGRRAPAPSRSLR